MLRAAFLLTCAAILASATAQAQPRIGPASGKPVPRFESLRAGPLNARRGPSIEHDRVWIYHRAGLPMQVVAEAGDWRQLRDPDGELVWMRQHNLSARRTAMVAAKEAAPMLAKPRAEKALRARLQPGVIVEVLACESGWAEVQAKTRRGWVEAQALWGAGCA